MKRRRSEASKASLPEELRETIKEAGLRYTGDQQPGIRRIARGKSFTYSTSSGARVTDAATLGRIKRLAVPPAWSNVWICPFENGHIQATGRDQRGRKQYRYHHRWRAQRDENKFGRMIAFGKALPHIRRRVKRDLARRGLPREKVLATVVRLLETTLIRVGNDEYARENGSYGLTTMRNRHVRVRRDKLEFTFRGKSGKRHQISLRDPHLAKIVRRCQDLPGQELFEYEDESGVHRISSEDVNAYLRELASEEFTAKDFRTWSGTVLAALALREFGHVETHRQAKKNIVAAIEAVSKMLGNTPAVCRSCYVHPEILQSYLDGGTISVIRQRASRKIDQSIGKLKPEEAAVLVLLQRRLSSGSAR